jgi:hypothetical protein
MGEVPVVGADNSRRLAGVQFANRMASNCFHCKIEIAWVALAIIDRVRRIAY